MRLPLALILAATTATAQDRLNAEQFDALVTGLTITYLADDGVTVGVEAYHPNGRVTWVVSDGVCQKGRWYQEGEQICFIYQGYDTPECTWFSHREGTFISAHTSGSVTWTSTSVSTDPIPCAMDYVGS